jgi:exopolysaccharide biosynthesis predicted pyruvyltransferase EpsI
MKLGNVARACRSCAGTTSEFSPQTQRCRKTILYACHTSLQLLRRDDAFVNTTPEGFRRRIVLPDMPFEVVGCG